MKYIKRFENEDIRNKDIPYKKGDYLLCNFDDMYMYNVVVKMIKDFKIDVNDVYCSNALIDNNPNSELLIYLGDVIKKLEPDEIEMYININKYNL